VTITDDERLALAKEILANTREDWLTAHKRLMTQLLNAAHLHEQGQRLDAFSQVVFAFNEYAVKNNAPDDVRATLFDMQGEFLNILQGRPSILTTQQTSSSPRTLSQNEALWAAASVYVDFNGGTFASCEKAEDKLLNANCPLPSNAVHPGKKRGAHIANWRKQKRSNRGSDVTDRLFEAFTDVVNQWVGKYRMSAENAAEMMLDRAIENHPHRVT
jgi:hypothetical protein